MAQADIAEKKFIALNDVFADIFNVLVFEGKQQMTNCCMSRSGIRSSSGADTGQICCWRALRTRQSRIRTCRFASSGMTGLHIVRNY